VTGKKGGGGEQAELAILPKVKRGNRESDRPVGEKYSSGALSGKTAQLERPICRDTVDNVAGQEEEEVDAVEAPLRTEGMSFVEAGVVTKDRQGRDRSPRLQKLQSGCRHIPFSRKLLPVPGDRALFGEQKRRALRPIIA